MQAVANSAKVLAGTVPLHKGYLLLHHHLPPSAYPSKHTTISPLLSSVQLRSSTWGIQANIAYFGSGDRADSESELEPQREADATFFDYERRSTFRLPKLASAHVDAFSDIQAPMHIVLQLENATTDAQNHLLVCTHGQRDCRCGDTGGAVVAALRKAAPASLNVGEIAHVGGHNYVCFSRLWGWCLSALSDTRQTCSRSLPATGSERYSQST
ncbi:hypothetical protein EXIGLDRAFT_99560 [Exidia glandulosa HHB12029]|uniref:Sucraseferredoxin-like protein n=1 Tax=Exidia glandulosa HHB12029 TaxID=1314781 RepID=A0A165NQI9_EXIGL|nr:hypothetical protein EXIGLDRAFT_99560 [Exidia glandulosa HHB12029]